MLCGGSNPAFRFIGASLLSTDQTLAEPDDFWQALFHARFPRAELTRGNRREENSRHDARYDAGCDAGRRSFNTVGIEANGLGKSLAR
jgi:hypothetical protein